jgi:hypothetical protein
VFELLRSTQPFNAVSTGKLHPLHTLQFLSNTDKHQLLNIVANNQVDMGGVSVDPEPSGGVVSTVNQGVVTKGSVLARVEFARPTRPGKTSVTLRPVFAFEQIFRYVDQDGTIGHFRRILLCGSGGGGLAGRTLVSCERENQR